MKKIFTLVCAAVIAVSTMNANVLLKESFGQETETLATNDNAFGNEIEATGWTNINGSGQIYMNSSDLVYAGYKSASDGTGSAEFKATFGKKAASPLSKNINSGSIYAAAIMDISAVGATGRDYNFALCTGTSSLATATNHFARINIRQGASSGFRIAVAKGAEANTLFLRWSDDLAFGTYLVVVEYQFVSGDNNDVVKLYMNPVKDKPSPTLTCVQDTIRESDSRNFGASQVADASGLKSVMLYSSSTNKAAIRIDELKVVTDWADLWESGEPEVGSPTITAESEVEFGNVTINEAAEKKVTVSGSDLKGAISVASDNAVLVPSVSSISKAEAEAGYELTLTLTAAEAGAGSAKVTLSSEDATNKVINISWTAAAPVSKISIAEAKLLAEEAELTLNDVVVIRVFNDGAALTVQDATGALNLADYYSVAASWKVGDKISGLSGIIMASGDQIEGFCTVFPASGSVAASSVAVEPFAVSLSEFTKYGPALIKVEGVSFPSDKEKFAAGGITISQDAASANLQIPAGCDIIGEDVPAKADVKGLVCHPYFTNNILISASADVYNRVQKDPTGMESIQPAKGKAVKFVRNGQLVILRDGKEYNVLGAEN